MVADRVNLRNKGSVYRATLALDMHDPNANLAFALTRIVEEHETLSRQDAASLLTAMLAIPPQVVQVGALLGAVGVRGETAEEVAGFVDAMVAAAVPIPLETAERLRLVDTCGTGADASGTFNVSTAAALVAAAAGAKVAKHGNRAITSGCGSGDVLEALGMCVSLGAAEAAQALRVDGFAYLHAPVFHPRFAGIGAVRRQLGIRTMFHVVNPLANPAGVGGQVMGVYAARLVGIVAQAMVLLGRRHGLVVHGAGGMDELSLAGPSEVAEVRDGVVTRWTITPEQVGLERAPVEALTGGDAGVNAAILRAVFAGELGPRRDVVVLNAGAVLMVAGLAETLLDGVRLAEATLDRGAVTELVERLSRFSAERD